MQQFEMHTLTNYRIICIIYAKNRLRVINMDNYSMFLPSYTIGDKAYDKIGEMCQPYGKTAVVIGGHKAMAAAKPHIDAAADAAGIKILDYVWFGGECSYENVNTMSANEIILKADMIFAVGGGKATDTCKCIGETVKKPVFAFPTIASNCSCCTSVSIMYTTDGVFVKPHFFDAPPVHAFINTDIISKSPVKYMWAGMGDTYAKFYEATVSARGDVLEHFTALGVAASSMCVDPVLAYGKQALSDNRAHINSYELSQVVLAITVTTAVVSIFVTRDHTPDYNSGLAHAIFYALTSIKSVEENHLHGEVVSLGVLIMLICDKQFDEFKRVYAFNKLTGLPTSVSDIQVSKEQFNSILTRVTEMSDIKHFPYTVTEKMLEDALLYLEEYNKKAV